jgi:hypothetical protein
MFASVDGRRHNLGDSSTHQLYAATHRSKDFQVTLSTALWPKALVRYHLTFPPRRAKVKVRLRAATFVTSVAESHFSPAVSRR